MMICLLAFITQETDSVCNVMLHGAQISEERELEPVLKPTSLEDRKEFKDFSKSSGTVEETVLSCL